MLLAKRLCRFLIVCCLVPASSLHARSDKETSGDVLRVLMPVGVIAYTFAHDDPAGRLQLLKTLASVSALTFTLKYAVDKERPNGQSGAFPSGHAAIAFATAGHVHHRYGTIPGLAMYGLAGYVGWTRISSNHHDAWDVAGGAVLGLLGAACFTTPAKRRAFVQPVMGKGQIGFTCGITF